MPVPLHAILLLIAPPRFLLPSNASVNELIALRWLHFIFGIIWIGLLYFFNLVATPTMKELDPAVRMKVYPVMMLRAMNWFRHSALITVLVGMRYYWILLSADAHNAGQLQLRFVWFGEWIAVWFVAFGLVYPFQLPSEGILDNAWVRAIAIAIVVIAASWVILALNNNPESSNAHLSISVGGGIGLLMMLNTWGVVWRVQKRMIEWTRLNAEHGTPIPPEAERTARWGFLASRVGFWLSFPMLFFMGAAEHYPFLHNITN